MSRRISRAALRHLVKSIAPIAAASRAERIQKEQDDAVKKVAAKAKAEFDRLNAPHPLDAAVQRERLVKQQTPARTKKTVESDVFVSGTAIAARKAPKAPAKF